MYQEERNNPVGWKTPDNHHISYISPSSYEKPDIICHINATPANHSVTVKAGHQIKIQWTNWPKGHHGPVIDYLARCNGPCAKAEKTLLKFNKIDEKGMIADTPAPGQPGTYATDELIAAGSSWIVTIPEDIAPGEVVLRHEIISLHVGYEPDGAQHYPQCINLIITGSGTDKLEGGTLGESLYKPTDPGIDINIYEHHQSYIIPGPPLYKGGSSVPSPTTSLVATSSSASIITTSSSASRVATSSLPPTLTPKYPQGSLSTGVSKPSGTAATTATVPPHTPISPSSPTSSTHTKPSPTASVPVVVESPRYPSHLNPSYQIAEDHSTPTTAKPLNVKASTESKNPNSNLSDTEISTILKLLDQILTLLKAIQNNLKLHGHHARDIARP